MEIVSKETSEPLIDMFPLYRNYLQLVSCTSKDGQYSGQKKKKKKKKGGKNNDLQNTRQKTKIEQHEPH